jgi:hypothetical protein
MPVNSVRQDCQGRAAGGVDRQRGALLFLAFRLTFHLAAPMAPGLASRFENEYAGSGRLGAAWIRATGGRDCKLA